MLSFKEIQISDKPWIDELLALSDYMGCEYSFANNFAWRRLKNTKVTRWKNFYISCNYDDNGKPVFTFPAGDGDLEELIAELAAYSATFSMPLVFATVNAEMLAILRSIYDRKIHAEPQRDSFDYIYRTDELTALAGKKFHSKRNHITNFKKNEWGFEALTPKDFADCISFAAQSYNSAHGYDDYSSVVEQFAINTFFEYFDELGLIGGVLRSRGGLAGFTIGERLNSNTFVIHIEKADASIQGAYPTLFNEFVKAQAQDFLYINREEDLGIEGLRKSKMSYNPITLYEKYRVSFPASF
ncbi:MAG: phosphatidylglycerol lysyltransferase domain-containing protein [Oscillospiraceae bacterium]